MAPHIAHCRWGARSTIAVGVHVCARRCNGELKCWPHVAHSNPITTVVRSHTELEWFPVLTSTGEAFGPLLATFKGHSAAGGGQTCICLERSDLEFSPLGDSGVPCDTNSIVTPWKEGDYYTVLLGALSHHGLMQWSGWRLKMEFLTQRVRAAVNSDIADPMCSDDSHIVENFDGCRTLCLENQQCIAISFSSVRNNECHLYMYGKKWPWSKR